MKRCTQASWKLVAGRPGPRSCTEIDQQLAHEPGVVSCLKLPLLSLPLLCLLLHRTDQDLRLKSSQPLLRVHLFFLHWIPASPAPGVLIKEAYSHLGCVQSFLHHRPCRSSPPHCYLLPLHPSRQVVQPARSLRHTESKLAFCPALCLSLSLSLSPVCM